MYLSTGYFPVFYKKTIILTFFYHILLERLKNKCTQGGTMKKKVRLLPILLSSLLIFQSIPVYADTEDLKPTTENEIAIETEAEIAETEPESEVETEESVLETDILEETESESESETESETSSETEETEETVEQQDLSDIFLEYKKESFTFTDSILSISGDMPENAKITVNEASDLTTVNEETENLGEMIKAYDIVITYLDQDGNEVEYQPVDYGKSLNISIKGITMPSEEISAYRIDENNINTVPVVTEGNETIITADHFTYYAIYRYNEEHGAWCSYDAYDENTSAVLKRPVDWITPIMQMASAENRQDIQYQNIKDFKWSETPFTSAYIISDVDASSSGEKQPKNPIYIRPSAEQNVVEFYTASTTVYLPISIQFSPYQNLEHVSFINDERIKGDFVESFQAGFAGCSKLKGVNLYFSCPKLKSVCSMFAGCDNLEYAYLDIKNTTNLEDIRNLFGSSCPSLRYVSFDFNWDNITKVEYAFTGIPWDKIVSYEIDLRNVRLKQNMRDMMLNKVIFGNIKDYNGFILTPTESEIPFIIDNELGDSRNQVYHGAFIKLSTDYESNPYYFTSTTSPQKIELIDSLSEENLENQREIVYEIGEYKFVGLSYGCVYRKYFLHTFHYDVPGSTPEDANTSIEKGYWDVFGEYSSGMKWGQSPYYRQISSYAYNTSTVPHYYRLITEPHGYSHDLRDYKLFSSYSPYWGIDTRLYTFDDLPDIGSATFNYESITEDDIYNTVFKLLECDKHTGMDDDIPFAAVENKVPFNPGIWEYVWDDTSVTRDNYDKLYYKSMDESTFLSTNTYPYLEVENHPGIYITLEPHPKNPSWNTLMMYNCTGKELKYTEWSDWGNGRWELYEAFFPSFYASDAGVPKNIDRALDFTYGWGAAGEDTKYIPHPIENSPNKTEESKNPETKPGSEELNKPANVIENAQVLPPSTTEPKANPVNNKPGYTLTIEKEPDIIVKPNVTNEDIAKAKEATSKKEKETEIEIPAENIITVSSAPKKEPFRPLKKIKELPSILSDFIESDVEDGSVIWHFNVGLVLFFGLLFILFRKPRYSKDDHVLVMLKTGEIEGFVVKVRHLHLWFKYDISDEKGGEAIEKKIRESWIRLYDKKSK